MYANSAQPPADSTRACTRNQRSVTSAPNCRRVARRPPSWRRDAGSVSGSVKAAAASSAPMTASTTNWPRQSANRAIWAPASGARIGARPVTSTMSENTRAASAPSNRSRTIARAITIPAAPARPCSSRSAMSAQMDGARAHSTEVTA